MFWKEGSVDGAPVAVSGRGAGSEQGAAVEPAGAEWFLLEGKPAGFIDP